MSCPIPGKAIGRRRVAATAPVLGAGIVAALLFHIPNVVRAGATLDRVQASNAMVVAVEPGYPPFSFLDQQGRMEGFDVDVAEAVAGRLGVTLRIESPPCDTVNAGNWRGRWDVCICSMTPDPRKAKVLDFVAPYYESPVVVVTTASNKALRTARDISGRRIGVEQGSTYQRYLQHDLDLSVPGSPRIDYPFGRVRIVPFGSEDLAYQALAAGAGKPLDAVISSLATARYRMNKSPGRFRIVGQPLYAEPNWIAVDKGDQEWQQKLRVIIGELRADGTLTRISRKWLGDDFTR